MIQKLTVLTVFSVSALFAASRICADQTGMPSGVFSQIVSNDKLLINPVVSINRVVFKKRMMNIPKIIKNDDIMSLLQSSRAVNSGA